MKGTPKKGYPLWPRCWLRRFQDAKLLKRDPTIVEANSPGDHPPAAQGSVPPRET
jgi:hypothetical protein